MQLYRRLLENESECNSVYYSTSERHALDKIKFVKGLHSGDTENKKTQEDAMCPCCHELNLQCGSLSLRFQVFISNLDNPSRSASQFMFKYIRVAHRGAKLGWEAMANVAIWPVPSKIKIFIWQN